MPLQATSGAASYDAFGGGAATAANYIEDVFSTWLYTGNGSTQTINNGIDLAGKGGMVWIKQRDGGFNYSHVVIDSARGSSPYLVTNTTAAQRTESVPPISALTSSGFSLAAPTSTGAANASSVNYASWTFREQPKFFDVVTYTGNGVAGRTVAHSLGSVPGVMIVKRTDTTGQWPVYHRSTSGTPQNDYLLLNQTASAYINQDLIWNNTAPTSTVFTVGSNSAVNVNGGTYVAYLFAHNAGGFGLSGTDNVISCGSYTGNGSATGPVVTLGYEPQWLMIKNATTAGDGWVMFDNMRGMPVGSADALLLANTSGAETSAERLSPTATGFQITSTVSSMNDSGSTYIYIAIRRGPMKVPTDGTKVFAAAATRSSGINQANPMFYTGWPVDLLVQGFKSGSTNAQMFIPRLTNNILRSSNTDAETSGAGAYSFTGMNGVISPSGSDSTNSTICGWNFRRAPGFFDEVCYTGTGGSRTIAHNLAAVPELMLVKQRTASPVGSPFTVYSATMGNTGVMFLNSDGGNQGPDTQWNSTTPTASVFSVGSNLEVNQSGSTYVAYLFASCPGVSRVGSYTGTGTTQVINCGFTAGSRFVMIKRVGTGDWYVWDSARGIVAGNDPYLLLNSTAAEVTNTDYIDTASTGFEISSTAPAAINANGGTFIFLAIA